MPKITKELLQAVSRAIDFYGSVTQVAKEMGVAHSTVLFWQSGKTKSISGQLWRSKICPVLLPFMESQMLQLNLLKQRNVLLAAEPGAGYVREAEIKEPMKAAEKAPEAKKTESEIELIDLAQLRDFDPSLDMIDTFVTARSREKVNFGVEPKHGYFAVENLPEGFCTVLPRETVLLAAGMELARNRDLVLARLRSSGEMVLRIYRREGSRVALLPVREEAGVETIEWDAKEAPGFLFWMYPVLEAKLVFRKEQEEVKS